MNQHPRELDRPHLVREAFGALGAAANIVWTPPARTHVELISLYIRLVTDGNAANREMVPIIGPVLQDDFAFPCPPTQAANTTYHYYWGRGVGSFWVNNFAYYWLGQLPMGLLFAHPEQLRTAVGNMQVGDQITAYTLRYQQWQDPVVI